MPEELTPERLEARIEQDLKRSDSVIKFKVKIDFWKRYTVGLFIEKQITWEEENHIRKFLRSAKASTYL